METLGLRMTSSEFFALGETFERLELIDGVVVMSPSPAPLHQRVVAEILFQFEGQRRTSGGFDFFIDTDIRFSDRIVYRPDVSVFPADRFSGTPDRMESVPSLVIEVLLPGNRGLDLHTKRNDYERFGVNEYWVVDPQTASLQRWCRSGTKLVEAPVTEVRVASQAVAGLLLDLAEIKRRSANT